MTAKETAYIAIQKLVDKFDKQIDNYKSANYNETLTRRDFIDPFFEALGWDINNHQNLWEGYRQVIHEDKIKIGTSTKAPDYSFRLPGGQRLFFVEAKKPNVDIYKGYEPARQVRLYGWNAKLAISIVTDFEEFAVYDCSKKPGKNDKPSKGRIEYFTYKDYLNRFDFIWDTFSHTEVMKGGLVRYQQADKKGTATVDKDFLASLDEWRKQLALSIAKYNDVNEDELNFAVQQTIDRLIFLRFAEDRQLEPEFQLKSCLNDADHYKELLRQFRVADDKYNSGLFHFRKEKENSSPHDTLTTGITVDNKTIKSIINGLYDNEYLFDIIPVEILGSAYEQFLGKRIVLKSSTRAEIEDKPEVRKAGGVYYTPQYIVDYIVEHTVGKLCEGKTPAQVSKLKIVDPACGSGSFLLGAYDYLLKWHMKYYTGNSKKVRKNDPQLTPDGLLTTAEKKRILVNNIYGVDIDDNAVEVTKLSLLLKCMEGETQASVGTAMTMFHERVLPSLENNIKAGNSLVDYDYYSGEMDFGEEKKVRPFSWQQAFPDVFKDGGFDAVIGNPPYLGGREWKEENGNLYDFFIGKYEVTEYQFDIYSVFWERGIMLLRPKGLIGYITPNTWLNNQSNKKLRKYMLSKTTLHKIVDYSAVRVFAQAVVLPILRLQKKQFQKTI
jgi:type I restriction-modification system DNA methylase subunit